MRTQATAWYDKGHDRVMRGIKVQVGGDWLDYAENGKAFLCSDESDMERKRAELRKLREFVPGKDGAYIARSQRVATVTP